MPWRVAFGGFAPGFAYLVGGDPRLRVPRRDRPRPSVPAGAVGLAGEFSGVYPRVLTGRLAAARHHGRRALGRRARPARPARPGRHRAVRRPRGAPMSPALEVLATGPLVLVEDAGRPGAGRRRGRVASGAADRGGAPARGPARREPAGPCGARGAARWPRRAGPGARHRRPHRCAAPRRASTGGRSRTRALVECRTVPSSPSGCRPRACAPTSPCAAGIDVPPVLGSRSTDTLSGLGPPPVRVGDVLPVGDARHGDFPRVDHAAQPARSPGSPTVLEVLPGPRAAWVGGWGTDLGGLLSASGASSPATATGWGCGSPGRRVSRAAAHDGAELPSEGVVRGPSRCPPAGSRWSSSPTTR